jgi:type I restriction enzyme S subunit
MGYISRGGGYKEDDTPVFVPKEYNKDLDKFLIRRDDIVIAMTDMKNNVAILGNTARISHDNRFVLNQRVGRIRILRADLVCPHYLYYYSNWQPHVDYLRARANSGVQVNLSTPAIKEAEITLPPLSEQVAVSKFLITLDDRITLLRETNATLEAIAQALFKSWFVDFDPVRAKQEGRIPEGMDEETAGLFPDSFEESELGMIPRGWEVGRVKDLGEVICGKTPPTNDAENYGNDIPFVTIPDMHNLLVVTSTIRSLSKKGADGQSKKYLPAGSICVSCIATPGLVVSLTRRSQTNQQINSVLPKDLLGKSFTLFLLRRIGGQVRANGSGGSVFHNLNKSGFEELKILMPRTALAKKFSDATGPIVAGIAKNQCIAESISNLRDTLLPRLISGKIRLSEAEEIVADA